MSQSVLLTLVFTAVSLPVIIFLLVALMTNPTASNASADEYLLADGKATTGDFINSSTGYMIQVSTTFYFIYWGYNYGLSNIFYVISWAIGILLFANFAAKLFNIRGVFNSIPAFIGDDTHKLVKPIAATAAILSFCAVFYVEAFFTADLISGFGNPDGMSQRFSPQWWATFIIIITVVTFYSVLGGLKKVIATDVWQLSLAYLGFSLIFSYLLIETFKNSASTGWTLFAIAFATYLAFLVTDKGLKDGKVKLIALLSSLTILVVGAIFGAYNIDPDAVDQFMIEGFFKQIIEPWGWFTLTGFVLLNGLWQFADSSNFQRISAVDLPSAPEKGIPKLAKMIRKLAIVSPLTWGLGIILGMLVKSANIPVAGYGLEYQGLISHLQGMAAAGNLYAIFVIFSLIVGLVSIMMSTSDTAIIAATLNYSTDIKNKSDFTFKSASTFSLVVLLLVLGIALLHYSRDEQTNILTVMAGAYSAIIVLAPVTIQRLLGYKGNAIIVIFSIILGILAAFVATFGPIGGLPLNVKLVLPIFVAVGVSSIVIIIGTPFSKKNNISQEFPHD